MAEESFMDRAAILKVFNYKNFDRVNPLIYLFLIGVLAIVLAISIKFPVMLIFFACVISIFFLTDVLRIFSRF